MLKAIICDTVKKGRRENRAGEEDLLVGRRLSNIFSSVAFSHLSKPTG